MNKFLLVTYLHLQFPPRMLNTPESASDLVLLIATPDLVLSIFTPFYLEELISFIVFSSDFFQLFKYSILT